MFLRRQTLLSSLPEWSSVWNKQPAKALSAVTSVSGGGAAASAAGTVLLPTFSPSPSEFAVLLGERLLALVQQLEPYTSQAQLNQRRGAMAKDPSSSASASAELSEADIAAAFGMDAARGDAQSQPQPPVASSARTATVSSSHRPLSSASVGGDRWAVEKQPMYWYVRFVR